MSSMKKQFAETSQSSAVAENITEDIIIDILSRLPAKSLMRFKCVSKRWLSLISDQCFAKLHLQMLSLETVAPSQKIIKSNPLQIIDYEALDNDEVNDHVVVESHDLGRDEPWGLAGSCHGLVSLAVYNGFLVYNPTTRESRKLPASNVVATYECFHGFGYISTTDDYKLVHGAFFAADDGSVECVLEIFSLRYGSWRRVPSKDVPLLDRVGIYLNGAVHWIVDRGSGYRTERAIIPFGLATETFEEAIPIPKVEGVLFEGVVIHEGCLLICDVTSISFEAWVMNEYGKKESWTRLFSIPIDGFPDHNFYVIPIAYTRSGKIVFQIDVSEMILFNPKDGTYKNYPIEEHHNVESAIYMETLVSPYIGHEQ
ncbi:F-box/kelch-repeat protein At3g23880-like [Rhodamnia argentea]|uniref:F-box/kelch-repeat protein At3g23880-like n=1 Tax=Rhodamnia argentea TaxID=178133 RepID=A0ABM3H968_9MYRT|nr:F-box/kelch-repeat protein At3g23880-like [Rhodamnia argentea]